MLRPSRALKRGHAVLAGALVAALLGCGDPPQERSAAPRESARARPAPDPATPRLEVRRTPDGRLRVRARQAPRLRVLQRLARVEGFAVIAGAGRPPARDLDLDLAGASVEQVLGEVLGDVPRHLHYAPDPEKGGASTLRAVTVGLLPDAARAAAPPRNPVQGDEPPRERGRPLEAPAADADLDTLLDALARAADPAVRAAAAEALGDVDGGEPSFRAGEALLEATYDPDPGVVAAAVGALEDVHDLIPDPRFRERVSTLAEHPDARVREAVESFLEWTEEDDW